jgi:hypothetical protein
LKIGKLTLDGDFKGAATILNKPSTASVGNMVIKNLVHESNAGHPSNYSIITKGSKIPLFVEGYQGINVAGIANGAVGLKGPGIAGLLLPDSLVDDGWPYQSSGQNGLLTIKLKGSVQAITLKNVPSAGTATAETVVDITTIATATNATGGTPPYKYQWYRSPNLSTQKTLVSGETSLTMVDRSLIPGNSYYYWINYTDSKSASSISNPILIKAIANDGIIRINAGAKTDYIDHLGHLWEKDSGFEGGGTADRGNIKIADTNIPDIFTTEHYGMAGWSKEIPNGKYTVKLLFCETFEGNTKIDQRIFTVRVNNKILKDIDPFKEANGLFIALVKTIEGIEVKDKKLRIEFLQTQAQINGIEIISVK